MKNVMQRAIMIFIFIPLHHLTIVKYHLCCIINDTRGKKMIDEKVMELKNDVLQTLNIYSNVENIQLDIFERDFIAALDKLKKLSAEGTSQILTSIDKTLNIIYNERFKLIIHKDISISSIEFQEKIKNALSNYLSRIQSDIKRLEYLKIIQEKNVVIVGGNGVGKSSFASYLKDALTDNIIMIPAQKYLYADFSMSSNFNTARLSDINAVQKEDFNRDAKISHDLSTYNRKNTQLFAELITVLINEHVLQATELFGYDKKLTTQLTTLKSVWKIMFPNIELIEHPIERTIEVKKGKDIYSINSLSDGEKAVLYYMLQILFVPQDSFVFVDEPETYLNSTISDRLWDTLEAKRPDVKFVYISHNVSFVSSRRDSEILWIKKYQYPDAWELEKLNDSTLPRELISELAGTQKPIIFVEGNVSSYDYTVFSSMFTESAIIFPVGGHTNVINYTRAYNNNDIFNSGKAFGIIDNDLRSQDEIEKFKQEGIHTLHFNEIEMLYFDEILMKTYLGKLYPETDVEQKISKFKESFFDVVQQRKEHIKKIKAKKILDSYLSNQRVNDSEAKDSETMVTQIITGIRELNLSKKVDKFASDLDQAISSKNYSTLLVLSPLKGEISNGRSTILDSDYMEKMSNQLKRDSTYTDYLKERYFSDLVSAISKISN